MRRIENFFKKQGFQMVVGIDEAGRGPLAGPVVAAAVYIPTTHFHQEITDSKRLSPKKRQLAYEEILSTCFVGTGVASSAEIDKINILQATFLAMRRAIAMLPFRPDYCLVDGPHQIPGLSIPQKAVIGGDASCVSISAASIVAKVVRDQIMVEYDRAYPEYGFSKHKGYPTKQHKQAILQYGICPIHRTSFRGVQEGNVS